MPTPSSFWEIDFKIVASMEEARGAPEPETPFRVLILGDFSGRANRGLFDPRAALAGRYIRASSISPDREESLPSLAAGMTRCL
jgi:hypothetical protein